MRAGQRDALHRYRVATGPDPHDPLISGDYQGWWRRSLALLKAGWRPMATVQANVTVLTLAFEVPCWAPSRSSSARRGREIRLTSSSPAFLSCPPPSSCRACSTCWASWRPRNWWCRPRRAAATASARCVPALLGWYLAAVLLCFLPVIYVGVVLTILPACRRWSCWSAATAGAFGCSTRTSACRIATIVGLNIAAALVMSLMSVTLGGGLESPNTTVLDAILQGAYYVAAGLVGTPLLVTAYADMRARHEPLHHAPIALHSARG